MALKNIINPFSGLLQKIVDELSLNTINFKEGVADFASLPSSGNSLNDARFTNDDGHLYIWNGSAWIDQGDVIDINWGTIGGTLSNQSDLQSALDAKIESVSWGDIIGTLSNQTDLQSELDTKSEKIDVLELNTKLLLHMNGVDGSTTFTDSSDSPHSPVAVGNAQIDTDESVFDGASGLFDGTGDWVSIPDHADWDIFATTTEDWTVDFRARHSLLSVSSESYCGAYEDGSNQWWFDHHTTGGIRLIVYTNATTILSLVTNYFLSVDTWYHIALVKKGTDYGIYVNGDQVGYLNNNNTDALAGPFFVGFHGEGDPMNGNIDEFRIQKSNGFEASPNAFKTDTIIVPTSAYTNDTPINNQIVIATTTGLTKRSGSILSDLESAITNDHAHSNKVELDLVTDGDHDVRTDNPHATDASLVPTENSGETVQSKLNSVDSELNDRFDKTVDDTDDINEGSTNKFTTTAEIGKLSGIEPNAKDDQDASEVQTSNSGETVQSKLNSLDTEITDLKDGAIEFVIDGGGAEITTGIAGTLEVPVGFTISRVTLIGDQSGSIVIDVKKSTYSGFPTTSSIINSGGTQPTLSSAQKSQDSSLTNWSPSLTAGDILEFEVISVTTLERCLISLKGTKN